MCDSNDGDEAVGDGMMVMMMVMTTDASPRVSGGHKFTAKCVLS